jgi:hypothetical protein
VVSQFGEQRTGIAGCEMRDDREHPDRIEVALDGERQRRQVHAVRIVHRVARVPVVEPEPAIVLQVRVQEVHDRPRHFDARVRPDRNAAVHDRGGEAHAASDVEHIEAGEVGDAHAGCGEADQRFAGRIVSRGGRRRGIALEFIGHA